MPSPRVFFEEFAADIHGFKPSLLKIGSFYYINFASFYIYRYSINILRYSYRMTRQSSTSTPVRHRTLFSGFGDHFLAKRQVYLKRSLWDSNPDTELTACMISSHVLYQLRQSSKLSIFNFIVHRRIIFHMIMN